ncbi:MAG: ATP-binding cassette domain-containing protein [Oscillospiraceae bacterium]|nr:ATP-binding cassette domain-containing protein [Oscillospiraceae bacterium]
MSNSAEKKVIAKVINLEHVYPVAKGSEGIHALKHVNLEFYEQEITAIIGQNGSGKTTLSKHFNGLLRPTSGQVIINGRDVAKRRVSEMAKEVGYVFQNPNYQLFCATVREEIRFGLKNLKLKESEIKEKTVEILDEFGLRSIAGKQPVSLGMGTKKVVALASVCAMDPEILFLDEPTTGQDQRGKTRLGNLALQMKEAGRTIMIISHDMEFVARYADRVVVMTKGEVIMDGTPEEVFSNEEVMERAMIKPPQTYAIANHIRDKDDSFPCVRLDADLTAKLLTEKGLLK